MLTSLRELTALLPDSAEVQHGPQFVHLRPLPNRDRQGFAVCRLGLIQLAAIEGKVTANAQQLGVHVVLAAALIGERFVELLDRGPLLAGLPQRVGEMSAILRKQDHRTGGFQLLDRPLQRLNRFVETTEVFEADSPASDSRRHPEREGLVAGDAEAAIAVRDGLVADPGEIVGLPDLLFDHGLREKVIEVVRQIQSLTQSGERLIGIAHQPEGHAEVG